ncbi:MAG: glutamate racemase [Deltaproteobacteria bacterium]|nr:glutamate racemase [Deltaproteobacteria bacterium]
MSDLRAAPIGVFDSGLGGLTVVRALERALPDESICYLGDTARVPYGTKSPATVVRYSLQVAHFLLDRGVKYLIIACNTASAHALEALQRELPLPVMGVVEPGARLAAHLTRSGQVGVIGTLGTVASGAYQRALQALDPSLVVFTQACPLLVPLAEEGWIDHPVTTQVVRHYLLELQAVAGDLDTLVLGCTHYPLLRGALTRQAAEIFGHPVELVDSGEAVAAAVAEDLAARGLRRTTPAPPEEDRFHFTDVSRFSELATRFLGRPIGHPELADL